MPDSDSAAARVTLSSNEEAAAVFGLHDEHLRLIERALHSKVSARGLDVRIEGTSAQVRGTQHILDGLMQMHRVGQVPTPADVRDLLRELGDGAAKDPAADQQGVVLVSHRGKQIRPRSPSQAAYVDAIMAHDLVLAVGPAGTGKTYLAVATAVACLKRKEVNRLVLCRPAVEAGERLGFLPGDIQAKVDPYLRPIYDALYDMIELDLFHRWLDRGVIEVAPLAFMRGRTLNDSFIVLDEAQNTTPEQMKMFLTRLGFGSKAVITGDVTQIDLPATQPSGFIHALALLQGVDGIVQVAFTEQDVVRHGLVQRIIQAYEREKRAKDQAREMPAP